MAPTARADRQTSHRAQGHRTWSGLPCPLHGDRAYPLYDPPGLSCPSCGERLRLLDATVKTWRGRRYREGDAVCVNDACPIEGEPLAGWTWDEDGTDAEQTWQFWDVEGSQVPEGFSERGCGRFEPTEDVWPAREEKRAVDTETPRELDPETFSQRYYDMVAKREQKRREAQSQLDDHAPDADGG